METKHNNEADTAKYIKIRLNYRIFLHLRYNMTITKKKNLFLQLMFLSIKAKMKFLMEDLKQVDQVM